MLTLPLADDAELRALEPWNAKEFVDHVTRVRGHLQPWISWAATVVDEESALDILQQYADRMAQDDGRLYGIWVDGKLAGGTVFRVWDNKDEVCEVGVWLDPAARGRGLITRAVTYMIDWAVCVRGMSRVEWHCSSRNERSIAAAQRLGMSRDGVLREASKLGDTRHDIQVWSVLAAEWRDRT
ncbi:GNAT family N-acetyltransferase [Actinocrispum wychmicini]|uniref:RimJ/RimL family protein N-acetyltransferase n=1 Tax=Actinocrispum wychmicini TaxID=1213861 RepID=A0A4R2J7P8_9PSEU|nr:GNAT family protein [Actinocrispum wychmicini]TCO55171.1 RimJ/RimL family protein N-acetyltransferase [Actinocrispum wychmicini]